MRRYLGVVVLSCLFSFIGCGDDGDGGGGASCKDGCTKTMAANCSNGPATQAECESDCNSQSSGKCASQYSSLQGCAASKPVTCDADGQPTIAGCDNETSAFIACLLGG